MNLKALDPTREINLCILLIAYRCKSKGIVIYTEVHTKAAAKWIITYKKVFKVQRRLAD